RILPIIALALSATACVSDADLDVADNKGYINVSVSADNSMETRASTTVSNTDTWIKKVDDVAWNSGTGYSAGSHTVKVSNYASEITALNANDGWGDMYFEGSTTVTVEQGKTATATVDCGQAKNARLKVAFGTFPNTFSDIKLTATTTNSSRTKTSFEFTSTTSQLAYFSANESISYTLSWSINGNEKTTTGTIALAGAATENVITINPNSNGLIEITISADSEFKNGTSETITIDAATGEQVTNS
ncbi:MAG: DUF4493 domain-containing protein, partial [Bacteroidaceae bacterium]